MITVDYFVDFKSKATKRLTLVYLNYADVLANADEDSKWVWATNGPHTLVVSIDALKELINVSRSKVETE